MHNHVRVEHGDPSHPEGPVKLSVKDKTVHLTHDEAAEVAQALVPPEAEPPQVEAEPESEELESTELQSSDLEHQEHDDATTA